MSHFKITGITHGRLFLNDGVTEIENGDFITAEQALAGLKFTPDLEFSGTGSFTAGAYTHPSDAGNTGFSEQVDITVNTVNDRPSDIALTGTTVKEFRASGTVVGMLSATDVDDAAAALTFELVNNAGGRFALSGGKIVVANGLMLDYEQAKKHAVQVKVTDAAGLSRTENLWINLNNVDPEIVTGNSAANIIVGGAKNDTLSGLGGNDRLTGGMGRDKLTGGAGADDFIFTLPTQSGKTAATRDIIIDFQHLIDDIDLSAIDANGAAAGNGRFSFLAAKGAAFTGVKGQLMWLQENLTGSARGKTIVMADINGDRRADFHIELTGLKVLTAADFVL